MAQIIKGIRERGKIRFSEYFKKINLGDSVAVVNEASVQSFFPQRIVGRTGKIKGSRGSFFVVEIKEGKTNKEYIIHPIHLKKLK